MKSRKDLSTIEKREITFFMEKYLEEMARIMM